MAEVDAGLEAVAAWLRQRSSLLLLAHERPDGDALGSLFGLALVLEAAGKTCGVYLKDAPPKRYAPLLPRLSDLAVGPATPAAHAAEGVLCLDVTERARLDSPPHFETSAAAREICVVDHHPDNTRFGRPSWVAPDWAATAQMLLALVRQQGLPLPSQAADCLLAGVLTDTGALRFPNTDARVLRDVAWVVDHGADYARVMRMLFMCDPYGRRLLEARLIERGVFAHQGRLLYAVLDEPLLAECGVAAQDTEGVIDTLKIVEGVDIACLLQPERDGVVRFSLRSQHDSCPVSGIARELGGGGHPLAAGARVTGMTLAAAEDVLLELAGKVLAP